MVPRKCYSIYEQRIMQRTLPYDLSQCIIPYHPNLVGRELLAQFIVGARELGLVVLRYGDCLSMSGCRHSNIYRMKKRNDAGRRAESVYRKFSRLKEQRVGDDGRGRGRMGAPYRRRRQSK